MILSSCYAKNEDADGRVTLSHKICQKPMCSAGRIFQSEATAFQTGEQPTQACKSQLITISCGTKGLSMDIRIFLYLDCSVLQKFWILTSEDFAKFDSLNQITCYFQTKATLYAYAFTTKQYISIRIIE